MYCHQSQNLQHLARLVRQLVLMPKSYSSKQNKSSSPPRNENSNELVRPAELGATFYAKNIGYSYSKWYPILGRHPELKTLKSKDVINSMNALKKLNFSIEDVLTKPMILYNKESALDNRYNVLKECGMQVVTISLLSKYVAIMNKSVASLKSLGHIPFSVNVVERLRECFIDTHIELKSQYPCNENLELKTLRQHLLNYYLQQKLDMSSSDLDKLWRVYGRIRHKSFQSTQKVVKVLLEDLQFTKDRIKKNAFILYGDGDNVIRIINEIPAIGGEDIKSILCRRPKIMMSSCDAILSNLKHIKDFGIRENAVIRCLEILTLGPDTVLGRLKDLHDIEEFQVLSTNPRVLRLIHYQNKARVRLDYLNQLKVRCASLHILSCASEAFAKFTRDGSDRTKGRDIVVYLSTAMDKPERELRSLFTRHPNWCHIPVLQVKHCYEYLIGKKFTNEDICNNIHLLLYPIKRIGQKLRQLHSPGFLDELHLCEIKRPLSNNEILTLILYLIESEFHFTGDGIWTEYNTHVENFNNLLPDFPESRTKMYKYGSKLSSTKSESLQAV